MLATDRPVPCKARTPREADTTETTGATTLLEARVTMLFILSTSLLLVIRLITVRTGMPSQRVITTLRVRYTTAQPIFHLRFCHSRHARRITGCAPVIARSPVAPDRTAAT